MATVLSLHQSYFLIKFYAASFLLFARLYNEASPTVLSKNYRTTAVFSFALLASITKLPPLFLPRTTELLPCVLTINDIVSNNNRHVVTLATIQQ